MACVVMDTTYSAIASALVDSGDRRADMQVPSKHPIFVVAAAVVFIPFV